MKAAGENGVYRVECGAAAVFRGLKRRVPSDRRSPQKSVHDLLTRWNNPLLHSRSSGATLQSRGPPIALLMLSHKGSTTHTKYLNTDTTGSQKKEKARSSCRVASQHGWFGSSDPNMEGLSRRIPKRGAAARVAWFGSSDPNMGGPQIPYKKSSRLAHVI